MINVKQQCLFILYKSLYTKYIQLVQLFVLLNIANKTQYLNRFLHFQVVYEYKETRPYGNYLSFCKQKKATH